MADLKHVGVLGMRWGIRKRGPASREHASAREIAKKHVSELSNEELKTVINRLQLEKQYKDISEASLGQGSKIVKQLLVSIGAEAANMYVRRKVGAEGYQAYSQFAQAVRGKAKG